MQIVYTITRSKALLYALKHDCVDDYLNVCKQIRHDEKVEDNRKFENYLSLCAIVKNEAAYLPEWIEYHRQRGVEKFYIYDNESSDDIIDALQSYIDDGTVEYCKIAGAGQQINAYNDCLSRVRYKTKWLGFIDIDEFIVPISETDIPSLLKSYEKYPALAIHWLIYGDSGHKHQTDGLVIERFTKHAVTDFIKNRHVKVILNPRKTYRMKVHNALFAGRKCAVNENGRPAPHSQNKNITMNKVRINHYYGKSWGEYQIKRARGSNAVNSEYDKSCFDTHNKNDVSDDIMLKYIAPVKEELKRRGFFREQITKNK